MQAPEALRAAGESQVHRMLSSFDPVVEEEELSVPKARVPTTTTADSADSADLGPEAAATGVVLHMPRFLVDRLDMGEEQLEGFIVEVG